MALCRSSTMPLETYDVQSAGLTADECSLAEQMFCSDDVRTPFESVPDDGDFDALPPRGAYNRLHK